MKVRLISAIVALAIFIPILLSGGWIFDIAVCILSILALKEFMDIKETKKKIPEFMKFVSYLLIVLFVLFNFSFISLYSCAFLIYSCFVASSGLIMIFAPKASNIK